MGKKLIKITPYDIAELFNKAYTKEASIEKEISSFKAMGIFPMNPGVFCDDDRKLCGIFQLITFNIYSYESQK